MRPILIFGSTGFLGKTFFARDFARPLVAMNRQAYDFTRPITPELREKLRASDASTAIILTAISGLDECRQNPSESQAVNVTGTVALLKELKAHNIKPVFFSTDYVFDGQRGMYREGDPTHPVTIYGQHKVQTENFLRENFAKHLILRTSKQVAMRIDSKNLLSELAIKLRAGQKIRCANDNWIAPVFVEDIVQMTLQSIDKGLNGTFHIAAEKPCTRFELGLAIADSVGASRALVESCSILDLKFAEIRPPHCTLDSRELRSRLDFELTSISAGLQTMINNFN